MELAKLEQYNHKAITVKDGIRLVILKASDDEAAPVHTSLIHTSLSHFEAQEDDHYTALSYVWGDSTVTSSVVVDGERLTITKSLANALRDIRHDTKPIKIWADGICIDQTNRSEKETQVALMGRIYEMASNSVVYLGPEANGSEKVMEEARGSLATKYVGNTMRLELRSLMERPWFTRTWVYQELVLSKSPRIQAGKHSCSWEEFYTLVDKDAIRPGREPKPGQKVNPCSINAVLYSLGLRASRSYGIVNGTIVKQFRAARRIRHGEESDNEGFAPAPTATDVPSALNTLLRILEERRGLGATDARDMLYAYLGLVRGTGIVADYSIPPTDLYLSFAKRVLEKCGSEALFEHVLKSTHPYWWSVRKAGLDLPSWVPDWTCETSLSNPRIYLETAVANGLVASESMDVFPAYKPGCNTLFQLWVTPENHPEVIATVGRVLINIGVLEDQLSDIYSREVHIPKAGEEYTLPAFLVRLVCENAGWKVVEFPVHGKLTVMAVPSVTKVGDVIAMFYGSPRAYLLRPYDSLSDRKSSFEHLDSDMRNEFDKLFGESGNGVDITCPGSLCASRSVKHFEIIGGVAIASSDLLLDSQWNSVPLDAESNHIMVLH
jgi:hypothetical protein